MSLATRCNACGTAFRVVQDQLKVSEGWVRCGHCGEVFDALEGLFDLERSELAGWDPAGADTAPEQQSDVTTAEAARAASDLDPPPSPIERTAQAPVAPAGMGAPGSLPAGPGVQDLAPTGIDAPGGASAVRADELAPTPSSPAAAPPFFIDPGRPAVLDRSGEAAEEPSAEPRAAAPGSLDPGDAFDAYLFGERRGERRQAPAAQSWDRDQPDFSDARYDSDLAADAAGEDVEERSAPAPEAHAAPLESAATHPEFLRRAEHRARWQTPRMRAALVGAAVAALAVLGLQVAHHFRDDLAVRLAAGKQVLGAWCALTGCTLEAPRRIDAVSVESTTLVRAPGSNSFRLAVALRNRATTPLATPSLDLTLTDAGGRLVARKALSPQDLAPTLPSLRAGAEVVMQAVLESSDPRVSGYTVEIFYP